MAFRVYTDSPGYVCPHLQILNHHLQRHFPNEVTLRDSGTMIFFLGGDIAQPSDFQLFSSHNTHDQLLKFCGTPKNILHFFANLTHKNSCYFDSFILDGDCCVGGCHFFF